MDDNGGEPDEQRPKIKRGPPSPISRWEREGGREREGGGREREGGRQLTWREAADVDTMGAPDGLNLRLRKDKKGWDRSG